MNQPEVKEPGPIEEVTRRWVAAWVHTRALRADEVLGWPHVQVGLASRATEIVCAEPADEVWAELVGHITGEPSAMLSVVAADAARYVVPLPERVRLDRDDEMLMRFDLGSPRELFPAADVSAYHLDTEEYDERFTLRLTTEDSVVVEGTVGVRGPDAVFDCVETAPAHRRRGLASAVMQQLSLVADQRGATTGLLVATVEGAGLYRSLGWSIVAPMRSLMGVATPRLGKWNRF